MKELKESELIEQVAELVANDPGITTREIARNTSISQTKASILLNRPITLDRVRAKMAESGVSTQTHRTIGRILTSLGILVDDMLAAEIRESADITKLLQLLNALSTVSERLAKAGIVIGESLGAENAGLLELELLRAFGRGASAARKYPRAAERAIARIARRLAKHDGPPAEADNAD